MNVAQTGNPQSSLQLFQIFCFVSGNADAVTNAFDRFFGIPYAKPPTGQLRFQVSYSLLKWKTISACS